MKDFELADAILDALLPPHEPTEIPEPTWSEEPAMPSAVSQLVDAHVGMTMDMLNIEAKLRFLASSEASLFERHPEILRVLEDAISLCSSSRTGRQLQ